MESCWRKYSCVFCFFFCRSFRRWCKLSLLFLLCNRPEFRKEWEHYADLRTSALQSRHFWYFLRQSSLGSNFDCSACSFNTTGKLSRKGIPLYTRVLVYDKSLRVYSWQVNFKFQISRYYSGSIYIGIVHIQYNLLKHLTKKNAPKPIWQQHMVVGMVAYCSIQAWNRISHKKTS